MSRTLILPVRITVTAIFHSVVTTKANACLIQFLKIWRAESFIWVSSAELFAAEFTHSQYYLYSFMI